MSTHHCDVQFTTFYFIVSCACHVYKTTFLTINLTAWKNLSLKVQLFSVIMRWSGRIGSKIWRVGTSGVAKTDPVSSLDPPRCHAADVRRRYELESAPEATHIGERATARQRATNLPAPYQGEMIDERRRTEPTDGRTLLPLKPVDA